MNESLIDVLARLERLARQAQDDIQGGHAMNGRSALRRIETEAQDARRWATTPTINQED